MKNPENLRNATVQKNVPPRENLLKPYWYISHWIYFMTKWTYGILGHITMNLSYQQFVKFLTVIFLGLTIFLRKYSIKNKGQSFLIVLSFFYTLILMFYQNYQSYLSHGILALAVQGRYIFPVIISIYILVVQGLLSFKNKYVRAIIFGVVLFIFVYGNMPFFMKNFTENWFFENSRGTEIIINTRDFLYTTNHNIRKLLP